MFPGISTAAVSVAHLLADPHIFAVPAFQRPYSWTRKEAGQLLDDLLEALGDDPSTPEQPDYFLGAMLMLDPKQALDKSAAPSATAMDIVDGQQRLVTLTILIAVFRDLADDVAAKERLDNLITPPGANGANAHQRLRLELRSRDQAFFERMVQRPGSCRRMAGGEKLSAGERAILEVRDYFVQSVATLSTEERTSLADYLLERCHVVLMLIGDIDRGYRMFCVMNDRGRPLARKDIIKAEVLGIIPAGQVEDVVERWEAIEADLGADFDDFFSYLRTIYHYQRLPVIAAVRRIVVRSEDGARFIEQTVAPLAEAYLQVCRAEHRGSVHSPALRQQLAYLGLLKSKEWVPAAMLTLRMHRDAPARLLSHLVAIDRFAHLLQLLCLGSGKRIRRFADVIDVLKAGVPLEQSQAMVLTRDEHRNISYNLDTLHLRSPQACKVALMRLNDVIAGEPQHLDPKDFTVEHVLPRKPTRTSQWREWFPDNEEREACTHALGNLVLVTREQNEKARNQEFARKKEVYFGTANVDAPAITREIEGLAEWRPAQVRRRERRMLVALQQLWGITA